MLLRDPLFLPKETVDGRPTPGGEERRGGRGSHVDPPSWTVYVSLWAVLASGAGACSSEPGEPEMRSGSDGDLLLSEVLSVELPEGFHPSRFTVGDEGIGFLSETMASVVWIDEAGHTRRVELSGNNWPVGIRPGTRRGVLFEVLDAGRGAVFRYSGTGKIDEVPLDGLSLLPVHGAPAPNGWFVAGVEASDVVIASYSDGRSRTLFRARLPDGVEVQHTYLTSVGDEAILTLSRDPYWVVVVGESGVRSFRKASTGGVSFPEFGEIDRGNAFPAVWLESRLIQIVADLERDEHWLMSYDSDGVLLESKKLPGPLILVGSTPRRDRVIGLRNLTGRAEAVVYRVERHEIGGDR